MADDPEVLNGKRVFSKAQELFAGASVSVVPRVVSCTWYGTDVHEERGAFCLVKADTDLVSLVGDHLRIMHGAREVLVYCLGSNADIPTEIALTRRAYMQLTFLATEELNVEVQVIG